MQIVNRGKSWFSPSHRTQSPCFISSQALLSCGALERARSTFKLASSSKSFWQEAVSTVRGTGFGALGANAFRPLGRDLGMPKGSRGGIWAIRPSAGTAQAARPPLVGLLWGGSSWATIYRCDGPKDGPSGPGATRRPLLRHDRVHASGSRTGSDRPSTSPALSPNFLHPLPGETVAARTRHCRTPAPPQVRAGDRQLPQYLWGRRRPPWYAPSPSFWSTWGRPKQDFCASLRTQPRARRANRAQSTAHH